MRRIILAVMSLAAVAALADVPLGSKLALGCKVVEMTFHVDDLSDGGVRWVATVAGTAPLSLGGWMPVTQYQVELPPGHALIPQLNSLRDGGALTYWRSQEGL